MTTIIKAQDISLNKRIFAYLIVVCGNFFYCYNFAVVFTVTPNLINELGMDLKQTALLYTALGVGLFLGALSLSWLITRWGTKTIFILIASISGLATIVLMAFSDFMSWFLMRFVIGFVLGGYNVAAATLILILFPPKARGRLQAIVDCTFAAAIMALGALYAIYGDTQWRILLWFGGIPPLFIAVCMGFLLPNDRLITPFSDQPGSADNAKLADKPASWQQMFHPSLARFTIICAVIAGMNFCGYLFFSGHLTLYLTDVRGFDAEAVGMLWGATGAGSFIGGLTWGYIADKLGRRFNAIGFILTAILIGLYLLAPSSVVLLSVLGFAYGAALACTYSWLVYFSEIFPVHLRPMGAALFHGGRIISFFAPLLVALMAEFYGLTAGMALAPVAFIVGAVLWYRLPETLTSGRYYKGYQNFDKLI